MLVLTLSNRLAHFLAGVLLVGYVTLALAGVRNKSMTYDEISHITGGYSYWAFGDYRLHPENGNLPQRWQALPLFLMNGVRFPGSDHSGWQRSDVWDVGDTFFHDLGNSLDRMLFAARCAAVLFGVGVSVQVYFWGRRLWGSLGGLLALAVCILDPILLAHGPLATSDMCLTCFLLASVTAIWAVLQRVSWPRLVWCALALGGLFLSKQSAGIVMILAVELVLIRALAGPPLVVALERHERTVTSRWGRVFVALGAATACGLGMVAIVWSAYGFRFAAQNTTELPPGTFCAFHIHEGSLAGMTESLPATPANILRWVNRHRFLPEAYTYGTAYILTSRNRESFFLGGYSQEGNPGYFPFCFLVKTPLPLFGLLVFAVAALVRRTTVAQVSTDDTNGNKEPLWYRSAPLWVLWVVYWVIAVNYTLNIGQRHILPTYPPVFVLAGAAARWVHRPMGRAGWAVVGLLIWSVIATVSAFPHYLAYFNAFIESDRAYTALVDSNLDWGQDLPLLRDRLAASPQQPVYLDYFGISRPSSYGIQATPLPPPGAPDRAVWKPGLYCISATNLQAVYVPQYRNWSPEKEHVYWTLLELVQMLESGKDIPIQFQDLRRREHVAELQYTRLLVHLRTRRPDDMVGYSILIYDIKPDELHEVLDTRPKKGPLAVQPKNPAIR